MFLQFMAYNFYRGYNYKFELLTKKSDTEEH